MVEATRDLADVLRTAEAQRTAALAAAPDVTAAPRARAAVRAARVRRRALVVAGAAAAVAVVVAGTVAWSPRAEAPPAGPGPSSGVTVPGLPPLRQADESDVREAPEGSVLAVWAQPDLASPGDAAATPRAYLLLVRPDGEVLEVGPAPEGLQLMTSWDRAEGTAGAWVEGRSEGSVSFDLISGQVLGVREDLVVNSGAVSPDGTAWASNPGTRLEVERDGVVVEHALPSVRCSVFAWADDAHLLLQCPTLDPTTLSTSGRPGASLVLMDAATGAVTGQRTVGTDEALPTDLAVRLSDGTLVATVAPPLAPGTEQGDAGPGRGCPLRLGAVDGLEWEIFAELPADALSFPGMASAPGGLLVSATTTCDGERGSAALWSVDTGGAVTMLLPPVEGDPTQVGLQSWVVGD